MKRIRFFIDVLLNLIFNGGTCSYMGLYPNGQAKESQYDRFPDSKTIGCSFNEDFEVGVNQSIVYTFDEKGEIISRKRLRDIYKEKGRLIVGATEVSKAYDTYQFEKKERAWQESVMKSCRGEVMFS
ncbi:MAG: hypothetical protein WCQ32_03020 [bacterium]